jgi:DNA-binding LacI/PurR family transcriptional regulator
MDARDRVIGLADQRGRRRGYRPDTASGWRYRLVTPVRESLGEGSDDSMPGTPRTHPPSQAHYHLQPATMHDVAERVGVSHQTVSRVLNGHVSVSAETRSRVLQAIEDLGYRRNTAARALVTRRSQVLGVVSFDTTLYGPASTLFGIEQAARDAGYFVSVASVKATTAGTVRAAIDRLTDQNVDGVVVIAPLRTDEPLSALPSGLPVVVVDGRTAVGVASVRVDQEEGGRLMTRHLLDRGARTVWHLAGPTEWFDAYGRLVGWRRELQRSDAIVHRPLRGSWSASSGYEAGRQLARRSDLEAVFVGNDQMALGVLRAFHEAGIRIPQDVLVAGFDDVPEAAYYLPPLTTIRQDFAAVGRRSIELLLHQVGGGRLGDQEAVVPPELVVRLSSSPAG